MTGKLYDVGSGREATWPVPDDCPNAVGVSVNQVPDGIPYPLGPKGWVFCVEGDGIMIVQINEIEETYCDFSYVSVPKWAWDIGMKWLAEKGF